MKRIENNADLMSALKNCKRKLLEVENRVNQIRNTSNYADKDCFEYFYPDIEDLIMHIKASVCVCETVVGVMFINISKGFVSNPETDPFVLTSYEVSKSIRKCNKYFKELNELIDKAQKGW